MGSEIFEVSKGRWRSYFDNAIAGSPTNAEVFIAYYKAIEADSLLITRTTKSNIDAQGANTEADFDNYAAAQPLIITNPAEGVTAGEAWGDGDDATITAAGSAGGGTNNTMAKAILFYIADSTGALTGAIPLAFYDCSLVTNGTDLVFKVPTSGLIRIG